MIITWAEAWRKYATPAERAIATATRRVPDSTIQAVVERARRHGAVVVAERKRKTKRGRRR